MRATGTRGESGTHVSKRIVGIAAEWWEAMDRIGKTRRRLLRAIVGIAVAASTTFLASPAVAAGAFFGNATLRPAVHNAGRTLSGQGVEIVGAAGAAAGGGAIALPIDSLEARGATPGARTSAALFFVHGNDSLTLSAIHFDFAKGILEGSLAGRRLPVFRLGTAVDVFPVTGSVFFAGGRLRLTNATATLLQTRFDLDRPLAHRGIGQISMGATESTPLPPGCTPPPTILPENPPPPEECVPDPTPEVNPPPILTP